MRLLAIFFLSILALPAFGQGTFSRAQLTNNFTTNFPSAGNKSISAEKLRASLQKMIEASAHYSELLAVSNSLSAQDAALINAFSNTIQSVFYFTGPTNGSGYYAGISTNGQLVKTPIAIGSGGSVSFDPSTNNLIKDGAGGKIVYPEPNYEPHVDHFDSATDGTIAFGVTNKVLGIKYGAKLTNSVLEGAMATGGNIITTLVPGANVTITGTGNTRTISATGSGGGGNTIYNADDSLTGNRIVNEAGFGLVFTNSSGTRFYVTPGSVTSAVFGLFNDGSGAKSEATLVGTNGVTSVNYLSLSGAYGGFQTILRNAAASEYAQIYGEYAAGAPLIITEARTSSTVKVLDTMTQSLRQSDAVNGSANSRLEQNSTGIAVGLSTIMPPKNSKAAFASINYNTTGGNGNLTVSHDYSLYTYTGTGGHTITLPSTSSSRGRTFAIFNAGTGALTLSLAVTVSGGTTITSLAANEYLLIFYDNGVTIRGFKQ